MSIGDKSMTPNYNASIGNIISREKNVMRNARNSSTFSQDKKPAIIISSHQIINSNNESGVTEGAMSPDLEKKL
jgi:hypothetical protein